MEQARHPKARHVIGRFAVLVGLALLPGLGISALGLPTVASVATLASLGSMIPALLAPVRIAVLTVAAVTLGSALALPASTNPWLACLLLGAAGAATGLAARAQASGQVVLATISVIFLVASPPDGIAGATDLPPWLAVAAVAGASAAWGAVAGVLIRRRRRAAPRAPIEPLSWPHTVAYAAVLALVLGIGGWVTVDQQWRHGGGWFLMTFLLVLQPYLRDSWPLTVQRGIGTVLGILVAAAAYAVIGDWTVGLYLVGAGAAVLALAVRFATSRPYWQYVLLLTPAVVLLEGMRASVTQMALERLVFTLLAVVIAVLVEVALLPIARSGARRHGQTKY